MTGGLFSWDIMYITQTFFSCIYAIKYVKCNKSQLLPIILYTKLDAEYDKQAIIVDRLMTTLDGLLKKIFSKVQSLGQCCRGSTLNFRDTQISMQDSKA